MVEEQAQVKGVDMIAGGSDRGEKKKWAWSKLKMWLQCEGKRERERKHGWQSQAANAGESSQSQLYCQLLQCFFHIQKIEITLLSVSE